MTDRSTGIRTTHTGSLPRPLPLVEMLFARDAGEPIDLGVMERVVSDAVADAVAAQLDAGISIINDGEQGKTNFMNYRFGRLSGFEMGPIADAARLAISTEMQDFPEFYAHWLGHGRIRNVEPAPLPTEELCCTGAVGWRDFSEVERDIANLLAASSGSGADLFMTAISPGTYLPPNHHYPSEEAYVYAMADVMSREYAAIVDAGILLQIDAPDLTVQYRQQPITVEEHLEYMALRVDAINHAVRDLPKDRVRVHVCWGADEAPHHRDIPLAEIVHSLLRLTPHGMTIPGANGRHAHEWKVWEDIELPEERYIVPGVIDSTTNIIEHPDAVAERIIRYAAVLGRDHVVAGVDCGFDTIADFGQVDPKIVWAKLRSLSEGAARATQWLW